MIDPKTSFLHNQIPSKLQPKGMTNPAVGCPLCGDSVPRDALEGHLRLELAYAPFICGLCRHSFTTAGAARYHFTRKR